mmetsp:Transcript_83218/g.262924  ORF Transcript_83218/g.262924 Transcript_83218/m.262924 type:complete len:172 (-) Transcript_83218:250-765(-)
MARLAAALTGLLGLAAAAPEAPYTIQLQWASKVDARTTILIPGIMTCFLPPQPSVTSNNLVLRPNFKCRTDESSTYHGGQLLGFTVYDPPTCGGEKPCPSGGRVRIHVDKEEGKDPVVTCKGSVDPLETPLYTVECSEPMKADDGRSAVKFVAIVVKAKKEEVAANSTLVV